MQGDSCFLELDPVRLRSVGFEMDAMCCTGRYRHSKCVEGGDGAAFREESGGRRGPQKWRPQRLAEECAKGGRVQTAFRTTSGQLCPGDTVEDAFGDSRRNGCEGGRACDRTRKAASCAAASAPIQESNSWDVRRIGVRAGVDHAGDNGARVVAVPVSRRVDRWPRHPHTSRLSRTRTWSGSRAGTFLHGLR